VRNQAEGFGNGSYPPYPKRTTHGEVTTALW
jgi:hypothetical protein